VTQRITESTRQEPTVVPHPLRVAVHAATATERDRLRLLLAGAGAEVTETVEDGDVIVAAAPGPFPSTIPVVAVGAPLPGAALHVAHPFALRSAARDLRALAAPAPVAAAA
jgi:hypothetical protein